MGRDVPIPMPENKSSLKYTIVLKINPMVSPWRAVGRGVLTPMPEYHLNLTFKIVSKINA